MSLSERDITRQYSKLEANTRQARNNYKPSATCYKCDRCDNAERVLKQDFGTVPRLVVCKCGGTLHDQKADVMPELEVKSIFYLPTLKECIKLRAHEVLLGYIFKGGLIQKEVKDANNR